MSYESHVGSCAEIGGVKMNKTDEKKEITDYKELYKKLPSKNKKNIKKLHECAKLVVEIIDIINEKWGEEDNSSVMRSLNNILQNIEFALQEQWGFEKDPNYHTWWLKPKSCKCPKLDNTDIAYFGSGKIINLDCPVHSCLCPALDKE